MVNSIVKALETASYRHRLGEIPIDDLTTGEKTSLGQAA